MSKNLTAMNFYIFGCIMFTFSTIMYYGLILFLLRKPLKLKDEVTNSNCSKRNVNNDDDDRYIKLDRFMFVTYMSLFLIFNAVYFLTYL